MIDKSYPPQLLALIHKEDKLILRHEAFVDWQTVASYRTDQDRLDRANEQSVRHAIGHLATKDLIVFQDQNHKQGRRYYAGMVAISEARFFELMYAAYREGQSSARDSMNLINSGLASTDPLSHGNR